MPKAGCNNKKQTQKPYEKTTNPPPELENQVVAPDTESSEEYICIQCKKLVDEVVKCERCNKWFCCVCQDISDKTYEAVS